MDYSGIFNYAGKFTPIFVIFSRSSMCRLSFIVCIEVRIQLITMLPFVRSYIVVSQLYFVGVCNAYMKVT